MKELYNITYYKRSKRFQLRKNRFRKIISRILELDPGSVLDVGCGLGTLVRMLRCLGIDAHGIDFSPAIKDFGLVEKYFTVCDANELPFKDKSFDVVVSTDFFEHLPEDQIDIVFNEMKRVGRIVMVTVAVKSELTDEQAKYHLTNKPFEWWYDKLVGAIFI